MKKIFCGIIAAAMIAGLAGCSSQGGSDAPETEPVTQAAPETETPEETFAGWEEEEPVPGTVEAIAGIAESDQYTIRVRPETDQPLPLALSVEVRL